MGKIIMGFWDCSYCDSKAIPGSERDCPNCGRPRPDGTKFYLDKGKLQAVDSKVEKDVRKRGRDWDCKFCGSLNRGDLDTCVSCGASRYDPYAPEPVAPEPEPERRIVETGMRRATEEDMAAVMKPQGFFGRIGDFLGRHKSAFKIGLAVTLAIAAVVGLVFLFMPRPVTFEITDMSWEYRLDIEQYRTVRESDWNIPPGGRLAYTQEEIHHYDKVFDHYETKYRDVIIGYEPVVVGYEDLGNGYFEEITENRPVYGQEPYEEAVYRSEPRYATKYYYDIDKWTHDRYITSSAHDKSPYWPDFKGDDRTFIGAERIGGRKETYYLVGISDKGKPINCNTGYSAWIGLDIGDKVSGKMDILGNFTLDEGE